MGMDQMILAGFDTEVPTVQLSLWTFGWPVLPTQLPSHSSISRHPTNTWISTEGNRHSHPCHLIEGLPTQSETHSEHSRTPEAH